MNKSILLLAAIGSPLINVTLKGNSDNPSQTNKSLEQISTPEGNNNTFNLKDIISSNLWQPNSKSTSSKEQKMKSTKKDFFEIDFSAFNEDDPWD